MNNPVALLTILATLCPVAGTAQQGPDQSHGGSMTMTGSPALCDAAAPKLRESGTSQVALIMTIGSNGHVQSFATEQPKGIRLEMVKDVAREVKAMHFEPVKKDGRSVAVHARVLFDCSATIR
jgi:hypothetical protein